jgi:streptogramin lyase
MPTCGFIKVQPNGLRIKDAESTQKWDPVSKRLVKILVPQVVEVVPEPVETLVSTIFINNPVAGFELYDPTGVAVDTSGNLFIINESTFSILRVDAVTGNITTYAGTGTAGYSGDGGPATSANFDYPSGVVVDTSGNLFIADRDDNRIRRVDAITGIITTYAGNGIAGFSGDREPAASANLDNPTRVAVDTSGNLFIADSGNNRIRRVDAVTGIITTYAGNGTAGTAGATGATGATSAGLNVGGLAVDSVGNVFIADLTNRYIRRVDAVTGNITTYAGTGTAGYSGDGGPATSANFYRPYALAVDTSGNLFISDFGNSYLVPGPAIPLRRTEQQSVRRVDAVTGIITTVAGNGGIVSFSGDGEPATSAGLNSPFGLAVDTSGNLLIADNGNRRIRRVDKTDFIIRTIVGPSNYIGRLNTDSNVAFGNLRGVNVYGSNVYITSGTFTSSSICVINSNTGVIINQYVTISLTGALIYTSNGPTRTAVDSIGNIFMTDVNTIRQIPAGGYKSSTISGFGSEVDTSSGLAINKRFTSLSGIALYNNILYFANTGGNVVCKIEAGNITNVNGTYSSPRGITVDSMGNLYVANFGLNKITKVTAAGSVSDIEFVLPAGSEMNEPLDVAVDNVGNIYVADGVASKRVIRYNITDAVVKTMVQGLMGSVTLSIDSDRNVYVVDGQNSRILKLYYTYV